jgi:uncharacterized protein
MAGSLIVSAHPHRRPGHQFPQHKPQPGVKPSSAIPGLQFAPYGTLAELLLQHVDDHGDGAHDVTHLYRVWSQVCAISAIEGGDSEILLAATVLHDCVHVEKTSPMRGHASSLAAEKARDILARLHWPAHRIEIVACAIRSHSYTANIRPQTLEAAILQDADRLDALGMIGIARCFYIAGRHGGPLYDPFDPEGHQRVPDETRFPLDHIRARLAGLAKHFQTPTGSRLAAERTRHVQHFMGLLLTDIRGQTPTGMQAPCPSAPEPPIL